MPLLPNSVHIDQALTNVSISYAQTLDSFVSTKIFPTVSVSKRSNKYFTFPKGSWLRSNASIRAAGTASNMANFTVSNDSYQCEQHTVAMPIDDQTEFNADFDMKLAATQWVTEQILIERDKVFADEFYTTGLWSADPVPSTKWDDAASTPIQDIATQADAVQGATGKRPNTLVLSQDTYKALTNNEDLLDRVKYTERGILTTDLMASLLDVKNVYVASGVYNDAVQGAADNIGHIFANESALLLYVPDSPGLMQAAGGYHFALSDDSANNPAGYAVRQFRDEAKHSTIIEGMTHYDFKLVASELGVFFNNCLST